MIHRIIQDWNRVRGSKLQAYFDCDPRMGRMHRCTRIRVYAHHMNSTWDTSLTLGRCILNSGVSLTLNFSSITWCPCAPLIISLQSFMSDRCSWAANCHKAGQFSGLAFMDAVLLSVALPVGSREYRYGPMSCIVGCLSVDV